LANEDERITKVEKSLDKLWSAHKLSEVVNSQFSASIQAISTELHDMKVKEIDKAVERQRMQGTLERLYDKIASMDISMNKSINGSTEAFNRHVIEEMSAYRKITKVIVVLGVSVVALIIDNQAGTHIIEAIWSTTLRYTIGVVG
jgi:hypothetical protein